MASAGAMAAAANTVGPAVMKPPAAKIVVTNPDGGETWNAGTRHDVTWTSSGATNYFVNIFLQKGAGTPVQIAWKAGGGKAECLIPGGTAPGNDYRITVVSVNNADVKGVSGAFTIEQAPTIKVTSPGGGEVWNRGGTYNITWTYTGKPDKVKIMLVPGNDLVSGKKLAEVAPGNNGAGSFPWTIPNDTELRKDYKIWVVYSTTSMDVSDQNFTIASAVAAVQPGLIIKDVKPPLLPDAFNVVEPEQGDVLQLGKTYTVSWKPLVNPNLQGPVEVALLQGDVVRKYLSPAGGLPATGSLNWKLSLSETGFGPGSQYRIRVKSMQNDKLHGLSGQFTFIKPEITVISPPSWTELHRGQTYTISWTTTGDCGTTADIFLTIWSDKAIVDSIALSVPMAQGSVSWTIPWYDDAKMEQLKPNGWIAVQTKGNPDIYGRIQVTVK